MVILEVLSGLSLPSLHSWSLWGKDEALLAGCLYPWSRQGWLMGKDVGSSALGAPMLQITPGSRTLCYPGQGKVLVGLTEASRCFSIPGAQRD